ncbi:MAG: nitronate monooxygenase, partial [Alphaproteobacteria bacterium]
LQEVRRDDQTQEAIEHQLMFSGHNAYRFASDPFYSNGFVPTVKQLVERISSGR